MIIVEICETSNPYYAMPAKVRMHRELLLNWQEKNPSCKFETSENSRYILFYDEKDYVYFALAYPYYHKKIEDSPSSNG
jgi:hypothetical protein